jgi:hypothetical protein
MSRHKDVKWDLSPDPPADHVTIAILMDIRDELQIISKVLTCHNTFTIPTYLRRISGFTGILAGKKENKKGKGK